MTIVKSEIVLKSYIGGNYYERTNDKKESMKPMSQAAVELDDEALDQVSGGLKRLDSDWKPEITEVCKLCGSTRNVHGGLCLACKNKC